MVASIGKQKKSPREIDDSNGLSSDKNKDSKQSNDEHNLFDNSNLKIDQNPHAHPVRL